MSKKEILKHIWEKQGFQSPSEIQEESFKVLSKGKSALLISPTGSGKTLAYLLPLMYQLEKGGGVQLCIVLPSQELAMQVVKVARTFAEPLQIKVNAMIGGGNIKRQMEQLKKHPEIIVGTPGRLLELMDRKKIKATFLKCVVLDEVDELLKNQSDANLTTRLLQKLQKTAQRVAVSATGHLMSQNDRQWLLQDFITIDTRHNDTTKGKITHAYLEMPLRKRTEYLRRLSYVENFKAIVFFNHLSDLGAVADKLTYEGIPVSTLASDQSKFERQMALSQFEEGKTRLLLTTDVASRGLDLKDLNYVIHYDVPLMSDQYLHRTGRVGRMGREGISIALVNNRELRNLKQVANQPIIPLYLYDSVLYDTPIEKENDEISISKKKKEKDKQESIKSTDTKKHKKNKKKKTKNKGARRKKSDRS